MDALRAFGARQEDLDAARRIQIEDDFQVYPENWPTVRVFLALETQWRTVAISMLTGGRIIQTGLDYTPLPVVMSMLGVPPDQHAEVFKKLQVMEGAALDVIRLSNEAH